MEAIVGKQYTHYKNGKIYSVLAIAHHTETEEEMVVYQGNYDTEDLGKDPVFVRPRAMWEEDVAVDGAKIPRFKLIGEN